MGDEASARSVAHASSSFSSASASPPHRVIVDGAYASASGTAVGSGSGGGSGPIDGLDSFGGDGVTVLRDALQSKEEEIAAMATERKRLQHDLEVRRRVFCFVLFCFVSL